MRLTSSFALIASIAALAPLAACSGGGGSGGDDGYDDVDCTMVAHDEFNVGLNHDGDKGLLNFKLLDMTPSPPQRLLNTWTIEITSKSTVAPVANATLDVYPYMPAHNHDAGVDVVVSPMPTAGDYKLDQINLHMPGIWEVTVTAQTDAGTDEAVFKPCIDP